MGADIYLQSEHDAVHNENEPKFRAAVTKRDNARTNTDREDAQREVQKHYDAMYSKGYFRDSYNSTSLFQMLGLSWWALAEDMLDDSYHLPIDKAKALLDTLTGLDINAKFDDWLAERKAGGWNFDVGNGETSPDEWRAYFTDKKLDFESLLKRSIELGEPLLWSV